MEEIIKLLLVEDDANLCYIIQGGLEDMIGGYKVLTASNGEARRLAQGGGLRLNDAPVSDAARRIEAADLNSDGLIKLGAGRKKIVLVRPVG